MAKEKQRKPTNLEPPDWEGMGLWDLIRSDFDRFTESFRLRGQEFSETKVWFESVVFKAGFQAVLLHRFSHWFHCCGMNYIAWFLARLSVMLTGAEIEFNARIGPGLFIAHPVGIVIGRGSIIGRSATVFQGVTFGVKSWSPDEIRAFPRTGDHCFFFAHAVVAGGVEVGDYCIVGANSVVNADVPDGGLVVGSPAKVTSKKAREKILSWRTQADQDSD